MSGQNADSSHRNEQPQSTNKKRGWKICQKCNQYSPPAAKICKYEGCKTMFPFKQFNWSEIDNMGVTNPTHQRELLEKRANILYKKHKWDVVVLYYHPHGKGDTVSFYGTPGVAAKFLGLSPSQEKMPPAGKGALDFFERFIDREVKEACTTADMDVTATPASTTPNVTTTSFPLPAANNLSSQISSLTHSSLPSLSNASSSLSAQSVSTSYTNQPSSTGPVSLPSTTNVSSSPSAPSSATTVTTNASSPNPFISQPSFTGPVSLPSTTNVSSSASTSSSVSSSPSSSGTEPVLSQRSSEKRIAYVCNNTVKALGLPFESRNVLHGHTIPEGSICVQITETCAPNIPAPLILGHLEDNCFLRSGMFFALPKRHLFHYVSNKNANRAQLFPYSTGV